MGRTKVHIKFLECQKSRQSTFFKRRKGLKKKAYEFATLCGVDACLICFEPQGMPHQEPLIWPEDPEEVKRIVKRYRSLNKEEQERRKLDLPGYLEERVKKLEDELNRKTNESAEMLYPSWDDRLNDFSAEALGNLLVELDSKINIVNSKIELLKSRDNSRGKEVSDETSQLTYTINHVPEIPGMFEENAMMDPGLTALQLIQPIDQVPISYMNPWDPIYMYNPNTSAFPTLSDFNNFSTSNDSLLLPPPEVGYYGNRGIGMMENDPVLQFQGESCGDGCSCSMYQFQSPVMEPPSSSSNPNLLLPLQEEAMSPHQPHHVNPNFPLPLQKEAMPLHQTHHLNPNLLLPLQKEAMSMSPHQPHHLNHGFSDINKLLIKMNRRMST